MQLIVSLKQLTNCASLLTKRRQLCNQYGAWTLLGEYACRSLFTRQWMLRDAAVQKSRQLLLQAVHTAFDNIASSNAAAAGGRGRDEEGGINDEELIASSPELQRQLLSTLSSVLSAPLLQTVAFVIKVGLDDKNLHVVFQAFDLLDVAVLAVKRYFLYIFSTLPIRLFANTYNIG